MKSYLMLQATLFLLFFGSVHNSDGVTRTIRSTVDDPEVISAAQFALRQLSTLSESGIYKSLSLYKIHAASSNVGIFHSNMYLTLELSSPYFNSSKPSETFEFVVMTSLESSATSVAFKTFPVMSPDAIEQHWISMVDQHRIERQQLFMKWKKGL